MGSLGRWTVPGLFLAGVVVAWLVLSPYRSVSLPELGDDVELLSPTRLDDTSDIWDYLQLGRSLYEGHGFRSHFTYPPFLPESVEHLSRTGDPSFPLLWRQPGYPVMVAGAFLLAGAPRPEAALWLNAVAIVLLPLVTYALGRVFLSRGWAALAGLVALLSPAAIGLPSPLVATTWFGVLLALVILLILRVRGGRGWIAAGVSLGILVLFRMETWILVPGLLVLIVRGNRERWPAAMLMVLGLACLTVLPWQLRLWSLTGSPFYNASSLIYHATESFPGWDSSRTLAIRELTPLGFVAAHPGEVLAKTVLNLGRYGRDLVLLPSPLLAPVLWIAFFKFRSTLQTSAYFWSGLVMLGTLVLVLGPMEYSGRFLGPLVPLFCVGAVIGLARLPRFQGVLSVGAVLVGLVILGSAIAGRPENGNALGVARDMNSQFHHQDGTGDLTLESRVVLADAPTLYAWIWKRHAVWAPVDGIDGVRELLPGAIALFTRDGGPDRTREDRVIDHYLESGGRSTSTEPPMIMTWPVDPGEGDR